MGIEAELTLKKAFTLWNRDGSTWKYLLAIYAASIVSLIVFVLLAFFLFGPAFFELMAFAAKAEGSGTTVDPTLISPLVSQMVSNTLIFIAIFIPLVLLMALVLSYLQSLIQVRALQLNGLQTDDFSVGKFVRLIGLWIYVFFAASFSFYNKTLMILSIGFVLFLIFSMVLTFFMPAGVFLLFIVILLMIPYIGIVIYNSFRLTMASAIFLHKRIGIADAAKESWEMTKGNLLMIFIILLVIGVAISVLSAVVQAIGQGIGSIIDFATGNAFFSIVFSVLASVLIGPLLQVIEIHALPAMYVQLQNSAPEKPVLAEKSGKESPFGKKFEQKPFSPKSTAL